MAESANNDCTGCQDSCTAALCLEVIEAAIDAATLIEDFGFWVHIV
jgi:hypothetical protein